MISPILRAIAVAVALAAFVDPACTVAARARPRIALVVQADGDIEVGSRLGRDLGHDYEFVNGPDADAPLTIVVGQAYPATPIATLGQISTVSVMSDRAIRIVAIDAPRAIPAGTALHLVVDVEANGRAGVASELTVRAAGVEFGRAVHTWLANRERWRAAVDVVPVGRPPFVFRVAVGAAPEMAIADVAVDRTVERLRVLSYEARPSWASTFVRRALEGDSRFDVTTITNASRGIAVRSGPLARLDAPQLDGYSVVLVGGLERLSASDVRAIDRFASERGGAVVLLPDARIDSGPVRALLPVVSETLLESRATLLTEAPATSVDASELLIPHDVSPGASVIVRTPGAGEPIVVVSPHGAGAVLFSGALDAWRYRAARDAAFDRFWRSIVAGLALAVPPPIALDVAPSLTRPGEHARVRVRAVGRTSGATGESVAILAAIDGRAIRLWPDGARGAFAGTFTVPAEPGVHRVSATLDGERSVTAPIVVRGDAIRAGGAVVPELSMLAATHGGIAVRADELDRLERHVRQTVEPPLESRAAHPMRSPWWMLPFAACLGGEWWIRRRRGAR